MKKFIAIVMSALSLCSMAGISANAEEYNESQIDIMEEEYTNTYDENIDSVDRSVNYVLKMGYHEFGTFVDNAWKNDSQTTDPIDIYTRDNTYIGTAKCEYRDNVGTDNVRGIYYSVDYYHYCNTSSGDNSSGLSETVAPDEEVFDNWIDYSPGNSITVKCFALT